MRILVSNPQFQSWDADDTLKGTYDEIDAWLKANAYEYAGAPREIYHSDPVKEKDASKWRTEIVWPVKKK